MFSGSDIKPQFILLTLIFLVIGIVYIYFLILTYVRLLKIKRNNKNYVGKLFYVFKFLLCLFRIFASLTIC